MVWSVPPFPGEVRPAWAPPRSYLLDVRHGGWPDHHLGDRHAARPRDEPGDRVGDVVGSQGAPRLDQRPDRRAAPGQRGIDQPGLDQRDADVLDASSLRAAWPRPTTPH